MSCSHEPCLCREGDPFIATIGYAQGRRHVDAGDLDALRTVNAWLEGAVPQLHIRFSDGEFMSILGSEEPVNCDGQPHLTESLGLELAGTLSGLANDVHEGAVLVGGDWRRPEHAWSWMLERGIHDLIPWCPSQVFANGIVSGETLRFFELAKRSTGRKYLVANGRVARACSSSLGARPVIVPESDAYSAMGEIETSLRGILCPGDIVLWAAGLGCKPTLYRLFQDCPGTTHLDVGCIFDGAAGLKSRAWLERDPATDDRLRVYQKTYVPWLTAG